MKRIALTLVLALAPAWALAAGGGACGAIPCQDADVDLNNLASLQRGAKYYVNYCLACHSLQYMSYGRLSRDLQLSDDDVLGNLHFVTADGKKKLADYMTNSMTVEQGEEFFGVLPPDLSLASRNRGDDWVYTYLKSFYVDNTKRFGINNLVFKDVGMPHVLASLDGLKVPQYEQTGEGDDSHQQFVGFEEVAEGAMTDAEYDQVVRDLVTFLSYVGEPGKLEHRRLGVWVMLFLFVFAAIAYMLKKEYWKDVH